MTFLPRARTSRAAIRPSPVFFGVLAVAIAGGALAWQAAPRSTAATVGVFLLVVAGWIVTVCLHEFGHAFTAWRYGDDEVAARGYLTLNPLKYSHPLLSIGLPVLFIALGGIGLPGGAVYLRTDLLPARAVRRISLAGPTVNAIAAVALLVTIRVFGDSASHPVFWYGLSFLAFLQVMATVLNLIPLPGLDGYAALEPSLSAKTRRALDQYKGLGMLFLIALLFVPSINRVFFDAVYALFGLSGVPEVWPMYGNYLMRFWL
ncbi:site-2 protease family protein [Rhodococcus sp. NPDC127528]|uniref:site-2 protease family protein n=1 Tax=unclassified Rhodococcus (in: high G+C Gram-positive bacteria) TaxID=192944 RepID=UPI0036335D01